MDPDCAVCHSPASRQCDCEARSLEQAVQQAELRVMASMYEEIRVWVRSHARDYILEYFTLLRNRRKQAHEQHMEQLNAHAYRYFNAPPHPHDVQQARAALKRGIDEDWQSSVQRYPEVLEYYFSLVELQLPSDDDPAVRDAPLSALNGSRKVNRRSIPPAAATIASGASGGPPPAALPFAPRDLMQRSRTPPPTAPPSESRRTPAPRQRYRQQPPPPPSTYYPGY